MYCPHCGKENTNAAKFCASCGKSLISTGTGKRTDQIDGENENFMPETAFPTFQNRRTDRFGRADNSFPKRDKEMIRSPGMSNADSTAFVKKKRSKKGFVFAALLLIILLVLGASFGKVVWKSHQWKEYYDLGSQYLTEENYEEAVVAFTNAIEIDEKKPEAYVGRGDAHAGYASELDSEKDAAEHYESAIEDYKEAEKLGSSEAESKIEAVQLALENNGIQKEYEQELSQLYDLFAKGDTDSAVQFIKKDRCIEMNNQIAEGHSYYDKGEGVGIGVYPEGYYYFGQWKDGKRSGHGIWIWANNDGWISEYITDGCTQEYIFDGEWADDKPNGSGKEYIKGETKREGHMEIETSGNYTDGIANGMMTQKNRGEKSPKWTTFTANAVNGIYQPIGTYPYGEKYVAIDDGGFYHDYSGTLDVFVSGFGPDSQVD